MWWLLRQQHREFLSLALIVSCCSLRLGHSMPQVASADRQVDDRQLPEAAAAGHHTVLHIASDRDRHGGVPSHGISLEQQQQLQPTGARNPLASRGRRAVSSSFWKRFRELPSDSDRAENEIDDVSTFWKRFGGAGGGSRLGGGRRLTGNAASSSFWKRRVAPPNAFWKRHPSSQSFWKRLDDWNDAGDTGNNNVDDDDDDELPEVNVVADGVQLPDDYPATKKNAAPPSVMSTQQRRGQEMTARRPEFNPTGW
jgi:hypothetical protein